MENSSYRTHSLDTKELVNDGPAGIYSPNQILIATFLGGPIAAIYFLRSNFLAFGNHEYAKKALLLGIAFVALLIGVLPLVPEHFPNTVIPVVYSISVMHIANGMQLPKKKIAEDARYTFVSNWKVFCVGIVSLLAIAFIAISVLFAMTELGWIDVA